MAKGQKRSNREPKKPKQKKEPAVAKPGSRNDASLSIGPAKKTASK